MTDEDFQAAEVLLKLTPLELIGMIVVFIPAPMIYAAVKAIMEKRPEWMLMGMEPKGNA